MGWIDLEQVGRLAKAMGKSDYAAYLMTLGERS